MSSIEALSHFFENIRPRYSWSSSESASGRLEISDLADDTLFPTHDSAGAHPDSPSSSSPPSSPMSELATTARNDRVHCHDTDHEFEGECANIDDTGGEGSIRRVRPRIAVATPDIDTSSNTPNIMSPSEGPENPTRTSVPRNPNVVHLRLQDVSPEAFSSQPEPAQPSPVPPSQLLSEDDGHKDLREKLMEIQQMDLSERERAQRMHNLMTEKYLASQTTATLRSPSLASVPITESGVDNPYKLGPNDTEPSYFDESRGVLGCEHYRRNVKLQCSTCERWYPCRFCHDAKEDHALIRKDTKNMLCMHCDMPQPAQHSCKYCGEWTAKYFCDKCKLWDDDPRKTIYHCNDCGICRIGMGLGKDFFHCKKCGVCMSIELEGQHRCIERSTDCDCPICGEYMFTSVMTVVFMNCGHSIHHKCYYEHMKSSYRCPTCARSVLNMEAQFRFLDHEIERQPVPDPYRSWHCHITCNDCSAKSDVPFHFLGLKCSNCKSYNTSEVRLIRPEDEAKDTPAVPAPNVPSHLWPNADRAAMITGNREADGVVTDIASVIREIDAASVAPYSVASRDAHIPHVGVPIATGPGRVFPNSHGEFEGSDAGDGEEEGNGDDDDDLSTCYSDCEGRERALLGHAVDEEDDEEYDESGSDSEEDDEDEELEGYEVIHLPFHP